MSETSKNHNRYLVPGLMRGLQALQAFGRGNPKMRLSDIARGLGISPSSAFRLTYTLEAMGFIEKDAVGNTYRLSSKVLSLGFEYLASVEIVDIARPILEELRDATELSAHLAILDGPEIVHLCRVPSRGALTSNLAVGARRPAHAAPIGRVLLLDKSEGELRDIFGSGRLEKFTEQTPRNVKALAALLAQDRARGHVVSRGSYLPSGCSVAAPVRGPGGDIVAGINVSGPVDTYDPVKFDGPISEAVLAAAGAIAMRLGYRASLKRSDA